MAKCSQTLVDQVDLVVGGLFNLLSDARVGKVDLEEIHDGAGVLIPNVLWVGLKVSCEVMRIELISGRALEEVVVEGVLGDLKIFLPSDVEISSLDLAGGLENTGEVLLVSGNSEEVGVGNLSLDGNDLKGNEVELSIKDVVV